MNRYLKATILSLIFTFILTISAPVLATAQSLNNFSITDYSMEYRLSKDDEGRSRLDVKERIVADFRQQGVNRGIERAIPTKYDGRTASFDLHSVKDVKGEDRKYSIYGSSSNASIVRIGDPDITVYGVEEYNLEYSFRDVTKKFKNTKNLEWYWDTNGTAWKVPINKLTVQVYLDDSIKSGLKSEPFCYFGASGSSNTCGDSFVKKSDNNYIFSTSGLRPGQNATFSFAFEDGTFAGYKKSSSETVIEYSIKMSLLTLIIAIPLLVILSIFYGRKSNRKKDLKPIPVEYIPPVGTSVSTSALVASSKLKGSVFTAQLIDLAVRHYIQLAEIKKKTIFSKADYQIIVTKDLSDLLDEEREVLTDMFAKNPTIGESVKLSDLRKSNSYSIRALDNQSKLSGYISGKYEIRKSDPVVSATFRKVAIVCLIISIPTLSLPMLLLALASYAMAKTIKPFTDKGVALKRYLLGFEQYIKASEKERLAFLQGPDSAQKIGEVVNTDDKKQVLRLYERALPYAILFGHEKKWTKTIGDIYEESGVKPDWYAGEGVFRAAVFVSAMNSFSSASSYSGGFGSSSSGGSTGGGFSGGGGGGGGGGGW